ncbi:alpha/beta fold hydrolase [Gordonia sp. HNM0687]|uniref:Alpha/beta fold hydrolase n=1 Tax=Gordonia mangrovi TaxID=2665643 RepID=A0A6L7GLJ2_9ACTN|nr:alpha/beta hydrolase [Gordonia mangrovi]MDY6810986.1 alpha/beta hydrolase [Actinomycetota bacterium]MXP20442.1 alpha/beta fold hydrolase [Gordonia mangrovi]UVF78961.1 alpha/beta hydrolase [Gordonia mangrovi]
MRVLYRSSPSGDLALGVRVSGDDRHRPPVLLVHGMAGDHTTWRAFARALRREGRRVISVDLRGHGRSGHAQTYLLDDFRDDLEFVLDELDIDETDIVAHSLGGQTALRLAMDVPGRVRRLVLEEVPPMPRDQGHVDEGIVVAASLGERVRGVGAALRNPWPLIRFDRRVGVEVAPQFETPDPEWWARLDVIAASTLIISGGRRSFLPPRHLRTLSEALPDAVFTEIDAGHSVHRDKPAEFASAAGEFLQIS